MKRVSIVVAILLLGPMAFSQTLTFQAGPAFSNLHWKTRTQSFKPYNQAYPGVATWLGIEYGEQGRWRWASQVGWLRKGGLETLTLIGSGGQITGRETWSVRVDYLSVNTRVMYFLPKAGPIQPLVSAGPRLDLRLGQSELFEQLRENDDLSTLVLGMVMGLGARLEKDRFLFGLNGDYYPSMTPLATLPEPSAPRNGSIHENTFSLTGWVGYRLKG